MNRYIIGVDYGSDSARAILVRMPEQDGNKAEILAGATAFYPRWAKGLYCNAAESRFRQHPLDYLEVLEEILGKVVAACPEPEGIKAISVESTGSTPCFMDENCTPLALKEGFEDNPDAMFILWKDHTGNAEAAEITAACEESEVNYSAECGFHYSGEAYWSKVLHICRTDAPVRDAAYSAIELCDWLPAVLTGCRRTSEIKHSHCAAGCKHLWGEPWGGYPPRQFFENIDPLLLRFYDVQPKVNYYSQKQAGLLCDEWKAKLGLSGDIVVGIGNVDGHSGAIGGGIAEGVMVMTFGTSSAYMTVSSDPRFKKEFLKGVYGQAEGATVPGLVGFECGMSSFGDIFAWYKRLVSDTMSELLPDVDVQPAVDRILPTLGEKAAAIVPSMELPVATDFFNGRRSPDPDNFVTASITGLKITTSPVEVYYALVEATAFATKANIDLLEQNGIRADRLVAIGGIAQKSDFVMQMIADVTGKVIGISDCKDSCAMGAVVNGSVCCGIYPDVPAAQKAICPDILRTYKPNASKRDVLLKRYEKYLEISRFTSKKKAEE